MLNRRIGKISKFTGVICCFLLLATRGAAADANSVFQRDGLTLVTSSPEFPVRSGGGSITGAEASPEAVESYLTILRTEWAIYPVELITRTRLKRIVLCKDLAYEKQFRAAVPDFEHNTLYLDALRGRNSEVYVRNVIHHELYHIIDLRDDGQLYQDDRWTKLNSPGFNYGTGGKNAQSDGKMSLSTTQFPGFLTKYSTTGVEEDKAELFAHMITDPSGTAQRAASDPVLATKIGMMKRMMQSFCPQVDAGFWNRLSKGGSDSQTIELINSRFKRIPAFGDVWWR